MYEVGVKKGDNVAIVQYNYPETLESMFACFRAGCGAVPINWRLHPNEILSMIDHSQAKAVIFSGEFNEAFTSILDKPNRDCVLIGLRWAENDFLDYEALIASSSDTFRDVDASADDLAWLFYTSGTTGNPKGAILTHRNLIVMSMNFYADICPGFGPEDVILHAAPLSHGSGLYALPNFAKGAANIILESKTFDPELVFKTIEKWRVTNMFVAPTMIRMLVESNFSEHCDHSSLKALIYGGAPILKEDLKKAILTFGPCLVQLFGQAESPMTITYLSQRDHVIGGPREQIDRLGSAGIPRTDVEVRIVDDKDNEMPAGEVGHIVTRSDAVMRGYWRDPEGTAETLRHGWLHTGDIGYMDERSYLFIMDREKDMIISGGENIYPREIEEVLIKLRAVKEVAVIGVPDEKWGEAVKAIVSLKTDQITTEDELISFCRDNIASFKKPRSVDFIDELPKNNYGKILKRELRDKYWVNRERKV